MTIQSQLLKDYSKILNLCAVFRCLCFSTTGSYYLLLNFVANQYLPIDSSTIENGVIKEIYFWIFILLYPGATTSYVDCTPRVCVWLNDQIDCPNTHAVIINIPQIIHPFVVKTTPSHSLPWTSPDTIHQKFISWPTAWHTLSPYVITLYNHERSTDNL